MDTLSIKSVETMEEIYAIVEIQRKAWDMPDLEIVPTFEMKAVSSFGTVFVAKINDDKLVGFIYAFPQFPDIHYSHMMAVLPEYQGKGIGYQLKQFHRNIALESEYGINSINWTVDPLLTNNAYLNFAKLGGICKTYYPNYYGNPESVGIYRGVPTDRFLLEWKIRDVRVEKRMKNYKLDRVNPDQLFERSPVINSIENNKWNNIKSISKKSSFTVQVPADYQKLKQTDPEKALEWRYLFRDLCLKYFKTGWIISDFHSFQEGNNRQNYYEFSKGDL